MKAHWVDGVLVGLLVGVAVVLVEMQHQVRDLIQELETEKARTEQLEAQWRRLQTEHAEWLQPQRLQELARRQGLRPPTPQQLRAWPE